MLAPAPARGLSGTASAPVCRECPRLLRAAGEFPGSPASTQTHCTHGIEEGSQGEQALAPACTYTQSFMEQIFSPQTLIINSGMECGGSALPLLESQKCWKTSRPTCAGNLHDPTPRKQGKAAWSPVPAAIHPSQPVPLDPCEPPATPPQPQYPEHIILPGSHRLGTIVLEVSV